MSVEHVIAFNLALLAALVSPGPALLATIQTALGSGRWAGILFGVGLASMAAFWMLLALLGLGIVFDIFPWAYAIAKVAGAAYLIYLAFKMWVSADEPVGSGASRNRRFLLSGALINLLNPKSAFFAVAVLVAVFPSDLNGLEIALVGLNQFAIELIFYSTVAFAASTPTIGKQYIAAKRVIDRCASLLLGGLGLRLALDRD